MSELLTGEEVLAMMDQYITNFNSRNTRLKELTSNMMKDCYKRTGRVPDSVLNTLDLEQVINYKKK